MLKFFGLRRRETPNPLLDREKLQRELLLRPEKKSFRQTFKDFFYDKKEKTCFTRTPVNWLSITIFYIVFLLCVFLVFLISMKITHYIAASNVNRPMYVLQESPIGSTPCLNYFPLSKQSLPLIYIEKGKNYEYYVTTISTMFDQYKDKNPAFNVSQFGNCGKSPYGYDTQTPCIYFRLNRLLMWTPSPYKKGDDLPPEVPDKVKDLVEESPEPRVWISCAGTMPKDKDHIISSFFVFQTPQGFDVNAFPYEKQSTFLDPIVALQLKDTERGTLFGFSCFAWAWNISTHDTKVEVLYYFE